MREQIARISAKKHAENPPCHVCYAIADETITLICQKVKTCLLADEEIDDQYVDGWAARNTEVDSPLQLRALDGDASIDVLRELVQAQLDKILALFKEKGEHDSR